MEIRKLPVGIENFEEIRTQGFYYVDKTLLVRDLLNGWGKVNLFTRPRRFGKTLNMSMLKSFFEIGGNKSLFDGLAIAEEKALCDEYMGKYPVVFVSLKNVDGLTFDEAKRSLATIVCDEARQHSYLLDSTVLEDFDKKRLEDIIYGRWDDVDIANSLKSLTGLLQKHYSQKVILLIDEYDVPLEKAYQGKYYGEMLSLIRALYSSALKTNDSLYFAVMTGCLRVSKESIFTGLNNLIVHTIADAQFDEFFGFTTDEVSRILGDYGLSKHHTVVKEWYDGYRFGEQNVYCPWDVIRYCYDLLADRHAEPQTYWLNTSGNDMVRNLIDNADTATTQTEIESLIAGESIRKTINEQLTYNDIEQDIDNIWGILFLTGYLTMNSRPIKGVYELKIPNTEVRQIYLKQVLSWFKAKAKTEAVKLLDLYAAFETGSTAQIESILNEQLLNTISFYDAQESFYHGFLLALLSTCVDWSVVSNAETGKGRSDIKAERKDRKRGFIVEVKDVKEAIKLDAACEAAIRQIEDRDYTATMRRYRIKDIWIYGIAFCDKECKVIAKHLT